MSAPFKRALPKLLQPGFVLNAHCCHVMQVQVKILYQRLCIKLDAVQLSTGSSSSTLSSQGTSVLSPCRCTAFLDLHRASGDAVLPQVKALVKLDRVQVQLTPDSMAVLQQSLVHTGGQADPQQVPDEAQQTVRGM